MAAGEREKAVVIFDYSGTLSIDAVRFAEPAFLMAELKESGLYDCGVRTVEEFWKKIVDSTWETASATNIGYAAAIAKAVREQFHSGASEEKIIDASGRFAGRYMAASVIADEWAPLLTVLRDDPLTCPVIATDHYAELTDVVIDELNRLNIPALRALDVSLKNGRNAFIVANSADLGAPKASLAFWDRLAGSSVPSNPRAVIAIDDFGVNEVPGADYGEEAKTARRQEKTREVLNRAFGTPAALIPFIIGPQERDDRLRIGNLIYAASIQASKILFPKSYA
ncbi:MAG: hypothetical protein JW884_02040 [Deltaproteobacteria bacterium]|nr:hypothetical protein [Deltaproteobacteria bacterium]